MDRCRDEAFSNPNMAGMLDELDKEAGIMAALRHPNVVMFLGVCLQPPCMVAEVCIQQNPTETPKPYSVVLPDIHHLSIPCPYQVPQTCSTRT